MINRVLAKILTSHNATMIYLKCNSRQLDIAKHLHRIGNDDHDDLWRKIIG